MDKEKVRYILESVGLGVSARKIDPPGKGASVTKLKKGGNISKKKIDDMYLKAKGFREEKNKVLAGLGMLVMDAQQQKELIENIEKFKASVIDNQRTVRAKMVEILDENKKLKNNQEQLDKDQEQLKNEIEQLKNEIVILKNNGVRYNQKDNFSSTTSRIPLSTTSTNGKINGWKIITKSLKKGESVYKKLYATKTIDKKQHTVYVGSDTSKAQDKINAYLAKKGIEDK